MFWVIRPTLERQGYPTLAAVVVPGVVLPEQPTRLQRFTQSAALKWANKQEPVGRLRELREQSTRSAPNEWVVATLEGPPSGRDRYSPTFSRRVAIVAAICRLAATAVVAAVVISVATALSAALFHWAGFADLANVVRSVGLVAYLLASLTVLMMMAALPVAISLAAAVVIGQSTSRRFTFGVTVPVAQIHISRQLCQLMRHGPPEVTEEIQWRLWDHIERAAYQRPGTTGSILISTLRISPALSRSPRATIVAATSIEPDGTRRVAVEAVRDTDRQFPWLLAAAALVTPMFVGLVASNVWESTRGSSWDVLTFVGLPGLWLLSFVAQLLWLLQRRPFDSEYARSALAAAQSAGLIVLSFRTRHTFEWLSSAALEVGGAFLFAAIFDALQTSHRLWRPGLMAELLDAAEAKAHQKA